MNYYMKNSTIVLDSRQEHFASNHDERFHLVEAELAIHPKLMNLEDTYEWGIWAARLDVVLDRYLLQIRFICASLGQV